MDVKTIVNTVCDEVKISRISTLVNPTTPQGKQLLAFLYATGRQLISAKCWKQLQRTHSFTTSNGVATYAKPADFYCFASQATWNTSTSQQVNGPLSNSQFDAIQYGSEPIAGDFSMRVFGRENENQLELYPTPGSSNQTLKFPYLSKYWIRPAASINWADTVANDTDVVAFDDDLVILGVKWRYKKENGLDFESDAKAFSTKIERASARLDGTRRGSFSRKRTTPRYSVPRGGW